MAIYFSPDQTQELCTQHQASEWLDYAGYRCPMPVVLMEKHLRQILSQDIDKKQLHCFLLIADDPIAKLDIPHFCNQAGHKAAIIIDDENYSVFKVTVG